MIKKFTHLLSSSFIAILLITQIANCQSTVKSNFDPPEWSKNLSIYEVNVRQYTPEGTFKAFEEHLPELKNLDVGIIWLMPINPIGELNRKGSLGSYYSVKNYKEINPEFGTLKDFKHLVSKIHDMGMYVIIDWVANHTAWDNVWTESHPDFFNKDSNGNFYSPVPDWSDVIDLNYDNKELWNYMIDAMEYWVKECNVDGFRCDVAAMVPTEFWNEARERISKVKNVFMLAEASESYLHPTFDMTYNWQLKDLMNEIVKGNKKAVNIKKYFVQEKLEYGKNDYRMVFTSNHDENTWHGTVYERLDGAAETFAVLCGTVPGMPLIYSGQEAGMNKRLRFFDKDTIEWKSHSLRKIYSELNQLKKENKVLWNGAYGGDMEFVDTRNDDVLGFVRENGNKKVFAIFNLSSKKRSVKFKNTLAQGSYYDLFNRAEMIKFSGEMSFQLDAWKYFVYVKQ